MFLPDISAFYIVINDLLNNDVSPPTRRNYRRKRNLKAPRTAKNKKIINYYITF